VAHTIAMFSFVTIYTAITLNIQSISFIDNREFSGTSHDSVIPPGPLGYQWFIFSTPISIVPTPMLFLNNWLTDGLLVSVYRPLSLAPNVNHPFSFIGATLYMQ
jgi:hypothetical protein